MTLEFTSLTPPSGLDGWNDGVRDLSWAGPTGTHLAIVDWNNDRFVYKRSGDTLPSTITVPGGALKAKACAWTPSGSHLAFTGHNGSAQKVRLYRLDDPDTLTAVTGDSSLGSFEWAVWDPTGTYLAVGFLGSTLTFYKRETDTLSSLGTVTFTSGTWQASQPSWSPNGTYIAVGNQQGQVSDVAPVGLIKRTGDSFAVVGEFDIFPNDFQGYNTAWHPDGDRLVIRGAIASASYMWLLARSGDVLTALDDLTLSGFDMPVDFHPTGKAIAVTNRADPTPFGVYQDLVVVDIAGDTLTLTGESAASPNSSGAQAKGLTFTADGLFLAYGHFTDTEDDLAAVTWWGVEDVPPPEPEPEPPSLVMTVVAPGT